MRVLKWTAAVLGALVLVGIAVGAWANEPLPEGESGERADALARRIEAYAQPEAWARTRVVAWTFRGVNHHLWDRDRGLVRVQTGDRIVWLRLSNRSGVVEQDGVRIEHVRARRSLDAAYARWVNDSFWLNPLVKLFDPGTRRELVSGDDGGLLVIYNSGGLTPGDAYLWEVDDAGVPIAWRMWVSIIPVGGVRTTWDEWITLSTGARISTTHAGAIGTLRISDVRGGEHWRDLGFETDPFEPLGRE